MRFRMARLMASSAFARLALGIAAPSAAQVSTGRIDASIMNPRILRLGARLTF
jgi:hypothetical protein